MECFGSCIDRGGAPVTILATGATSTSIAVASSPMTLSNAEIISVSVIGGLLLLGILAALAFILVRLQQQRPVPVRSLHPYHFQRQRRHNTRRYKIPRWRYANRRGYPLDLTDLTDRMIAALPRRGISTGERGTQWPAQGHGANDAAVYRRGDRGIPIFANEDDFYRRDGHYRGEYEVYPPRPYESDEGFVRPQDYRAAETVDEIERRTIARTGGMYDDLHNNVVVGVIPNPDIGLQHRGDGRGPSLERREAERGRRLSRRPNLLNRDV